MDISAVVLTKNEEKNIDKCLESLQWCKEIIVVDDNSTDKTVEIAKKHGAKILTHALDSDFATQRNFGLEKAKGEWVLFVDADEVITSALAKEIQSFIIHHSSLIIGAYIKRLDYMWGKPLLHGEQGNVKLLRLARKTSGKWVGKVHEVWEIQGKSVTLKNPLFHYPHQTLKEFLQEINFYSTLRAEQLHEKHVSVSWLSVIAYPKAKFLQDYIFKTGFLDGTAGFIVAILMSFHSFLVRGKLWQLNQT